MNFESTIKNLKDIAESENRNVYLVGGYIRDLFIKGKPEALEMDFAVDGSALEFARKVSVQLKCSLVPLDIERGIARVTSKGEFELDFGQLKGETIESDLISRDFTINAMACDISNIENTKDITKSLLDPLLGRNDIQKRLIRAVNSNSFEDDPLRILRAFTFAAAFGFEVETDTLNLIKESVSKLKSVAGERIRDEISKIFETIDSIKFVRKMAEFKIFDEIIPEIKSMQGIEQGPYHHLDIWEHSLESLAQLEKVINEVLNDANLVAYLSAPITDMRKVIWIVKLGTLLHDLGKPQVKEITETGRIRFHGHEAKGVELIEPISERLRLSTKEKVFLEDIVLYHLRPAQLANTKEVTKRAIFRLLRDMKDSVPAVCLVTIADKRATRGILVKRSESELIEILCQQLIKEYFDMKNAEEKPKRLLTGDDIIELLQIPSGPIIGTILKEVEESQAEGSIKSKEEAMKLAKELYEKTK